MVVLIKSPQLLDRIQREGLKSHKERVEDLNKYLANLSEHHDMYVASLALRGTPSYCVSSADISRYDIGLVSGLAKTCGAWTENGGSSRRSVEAAWSLGRRYSYDIQDATVFQLAGGGVQNNFVSGCDHPTATINV